MPSNYLLPISHGEMKELEAPLQKDLKATLQQLSKNLEKHR